MKRWNGFLMVIVVMIWMVPVSADETADDIVSMMGWWEQYGRYWDEIGTTTATDEEMAFALLEADDETIAPLTLAERSAE